MIRGAEHMHALELARGRGAARLIPEGFIVDVG